MQPVKGVRPVAIDLGVKNLEEAIEFYENVFEVTFETDEVDGRLHARLRFGGQG